MLKEKRRAKIKARRMAKAHGKAMTRANPCGTKALARKERTPTKAQKEASRATHAIYVEKLGILPVNVGRESTRSRTT